MVWNAASRFYDRGYLNFQQLPPSIKHGVDCSMCSRQRPTVQAHGVWGWRSTEANGISSRWMLRPMSAWDEVRQERERKLSWFLSQRPSVSQLQTGRKWGHFLLRKSRFGGHTHPSAVMTERFFLFIFVVGLFLTCLLGISSLPLRNILLPEQWVSGKCVFTDWAFSLCTATGDWCLHGFVVIYWLIKLTGSRSTSSAIMVLKKSGPVLRFYSFTSCVWGDRWSRPKETDLQGEMNAFLSLTWRNWNTPVTFVVKPKAHVYKGLWEH